MIIDYFSISLRRLVDPHDMDPDRVIVGGPVTCTAFTVDYEDKITHRTVEGWVIRIGLEIANVDPLYREAARAAVQSQYRAANPQRIQPVFDVLFYSEAFPRAIPELRAEPPQDG